MINAIILVFFAENILNHSAFSNFLDFIANSPHHLQVFRLSRVYLNFLSDVTNMYHYRVFNSISVLVPHFRIDLLGRKYPACVFHKKLKNFKLRGGELDRFSVNL